MGTNTSTASADEDDRVDGLRQLQDVEIDATMFQYDGKPVKK